MADRVVGCPQPRAAVGVADYEEAVSVGPVSAPPTKLVPPDIEGNKRASPVTGLAPLSKGKAVTGYGLSLEVIDRLSRFLDRVQNRLRLFFQRAIQLLNMLQRRNSQLP